MNNKLDLVVTERKVCARCKVNLSKKCITRSSVVLLNEILIDTLAYRKVFIGVIDKTTI